MHKLLDLDTDTLPQPPPSADSGGGGAAAVVANSSNMSSTSSKGLVAWWTFEDGGGAVSATDVTGHRFKTLIRRRQNAVAPKKLTTTTAKKPSTPSTTFADDQLTVTPNKNNPIDTRAATAAGDGRRGATEDAVPAVEGVFTLEERRRYRIPEEVQRLLPTPYQSLLPAFTPSVSEERPPTRMSDSSPPKSRPVTAAAAVTVSAAAATTSRPPSPPATAATEAPAVSTATPWTGWLAALPRWSWLEAETLPTPKAIALPASLLSRHAPPQLPTAVGGKVTNKGKPGASKGAASNGHPLPPAAQQNGPTHPSSSSAASATSNGTKSVLPVPSLRARGICPYELRRHRLATAGRELQREVDCPLGKIISVLACFFLFARTPFTRLYHLFLISAGCSEKVKMVEVRFHVRFVCQRRMVSCRFDFCHATFPIGQRTEHERSDCQQMFARRSILSQVY